MSKFGFELLAQQAADLVQHQTSLVATFGINGDTPIEQLFALALDTVGRYDLTVARRVVFYDDYAEWVRIEQRETSPETDWALIVERQVQLGAWRVDFLIHARPWSSPPSIERRRLIVECDGHDFHERTKEQAARDRSRDRAAVIEGIPVFRFTGSELWTDPMGCARQVFHWADQEG